ncbi:MAG: ATP-binding protein [Pseudobdellovibrionaceae bacterium]
MDEISARLQIALESHQIGVWDWNIETNHLHWEPFMYTVFGLAPKEFNSNFEAWEQTLHPEDRERSKIEVQDALSGKGNFNSEFRILKGGREVRYIRGSGRVFFNDKKQAIRMVGCNWDVTDERANQMALVQASKMASLGEMASGIAHEINNPLSIIIAKIIQMRKKHSPNESLLADLDKIETTTLRISKIVHGLLTFSRDSKEQNLETTRLSKLIETSLDLVRERLKTKQIELRISNDLPPDFEFSCRSIQMSQVLINLVNNSADAIESLPSKWIDLKFSQIHERLRIEVIDSGAGIPLEIYEKIMQPFFTTKPLGKGTGLGLSISRGIVESHNGTFEIDINHPNTCFVIHLPLTQ